MKYNDKIIPTEEQKRKYCAMFDSMSEAEQALFMAIYDKGDWEYKPWDNYLTDNEKEKHLPMRKMPGWRVYPNAFVGGKDPSTACLLRDKGLCYRFADTEQYFENDLLVPTVEGFLMYFSIKGNIKMTQIETEAPGVFELLLRLKNSESGLMWDDMSRDEKLIANKLVANKRYITLAQHPLHTTRYLYTINKEGMAKIKNINLNNHKERL